jgi:allantoicase
MSTAPILPPDLPDIVRIADPLPSDAPAFTHLTDLASELLGGSALATSDDFFAPVHNLVHAATPVFVEHRYTERGKWMDGWESRRRRDGGNDWAIVQLGAPGRIAGVDVDTAFFVGNAPEECAVLGCFAPGADAVELTGPDTTWVELVPRTRLVGGAHNLVEVTGSAASQVVTHLRLDAFPDGGVARLRAYGTVQRSFATEAAAGTVVDLACAVNGGRVLGCNDEFFCHRGNLILPGDARTMGEGWETRRRRGPGHDWIVVALAAPGAIHEVLVDTSHYKGNYPDHCDIEAVNLRTGSDEGTLLDPGSDAEWHPLLPTTHLRADTRHLFRDELLAHGPFTHLRLNIHPDGGVARLRVFGVPAAGGGEHV